MKTERLLDRILRKPFYGFEKEGKLYFPTKQEHRLEISERLNIFKNHKNWISLFSPLTTLILVIPFFIFLGFYFDLKILLLALSYTMLAQNVQCTAYLHRFCSHKAFKLKNNFWLFILRNATVKVISEEMYAVSHLVHHAKSEQPGDPYNALGGWAYCFFAEITHNPIALDLSESEYNQAKSLIAHTGIRLNSYKEYQKWGTISHPLYLSLSYLGNWTFWFITFYLLSGTLAIPLALFGMSGIWGLFIRNFNFKGHGSGECKHKNGRDFHHADLSVNIPLAGYVAGEWHNHHHLYPTSARNDFLPGQPDLTFCVIKLFHNLGVVTKYIDKKEAFAQRFLKSKQVNRGTYEIHHTKLS